MASIIKSNTYADFNGREILTANNDGALTTQKILYPAFHVNSNGQGSSIDIPNATVTKVILTNEMIDTDSAYDTSNGRFTPQVAGKYFVYSAITYEKTGDFDNIQLRIRKNNSSSIAEALDRNEYYTTINACGTVDMNGSTDYLEIYTRQDAGGNSQLITNQDGSRNYFGAYRIGS